MLMAAVLDPPPCFCDRRGRNYGEQGECEVLGSGSDGGDEEGVETGRR